jgi:uncharacterized protein YhbP (UPF0306 family)
VNGAQPTVEIPKHVLDYLSEQKTLTLATASPSGVPRASTFLYVNDGPTLYFWSRPVTTTARHLAQNPTVSFTIDEYSDDLRQTRGVQGTGECGVVLNGEEIARVADLFGQRFPSLSPGNTMSISFFRIAPTELQFIDNGGGGARSSTDFGAEFHRERAYSVFSGLPAQNVDTMSAKLESRSVDAGEVIVRQGGPADKFFIVVDGEVEVIREVDGKEDVVATLAEGTLFGEIAILRDAARESTVRAKTPTTLLSLDRASFRDLVAQSLGTTADFDQVIKGRLTDAAAEA